ncbi:MAG: Glu-tRNA(Gln) amidotransferase subunit GatD [Methanomassiliicoccales archaeon]|jgi:glutamyl-tRNA(Gln) amidotransferase subunit D
MSYSQRVSALLSASGAKEGDTVKAMSAGIERAGVLMPHHEFSHPDVIVLKLKNGYNIGIRLEEGASVELVSRSERKARPAVPSRGAICKKTLALIGTGGTIASYVDYRTGAVHPALSAEELVATVPEILEMCQVEAKVLFSIFSENMKVEHWKGIAEAAADSLNSGKSGCIIPHGTDTMGYTSAALSFMLDSLPGPVVLVGSQRSSDRPSSDAYTNLLATVRFCLEADAAEVFVLMHEGISDTTALVHRGTRVRKMHTSRRDAFESINSRPVARVDFEKGVEMLCPCVPRGNGRATLRTEMEENVALVHYYPGMSTRTFEGFAKGSRGIVIAGTGLGHISSDLIKEVRKAIRGGTSVVMCSQCISGRVNLNVYNTGRDLLSAGVISGEDMLPETAFVKLMWALANTSSEEGLRRVMSISLKGELSDRREIDY